MPVEKQNTPSPIIPEESVPSEAEESTLKKREIFKVIKGVTKPIHKRKDYDKNICRYIAR